MKRRLVLVALWLLTAPAHACMFARDAQPGHWHAWANALFAGDVTSVERSRDLDVITVKVVETFKGPQGTAATLQVPARMWASCRLERPVAGMRVLVALSPGGDTLLVPLTEGYAERLRQHERKD